MCRRAKLLRAQASMLTGLHYWGLGGLGNHLDGSLYYWGLGDNLVDGPKLLGPRRPKAIMLMGFILLGFRRHVDGPTLLGPRRPWQSC